MLQNYDPFKMILSEEKNSSNYRSSASCDMYKEPKKSEAQKAAYKLQQCFDGIVNKYARQLRVSPQFHFDHSYNHKVYKWLDERKESTIETRGDGKLSAKLWNGLMESLGIEGHRIKDSISFEEIDAFLERNK